MTTTQEPSITAAQEPSITVNGNTYSMTNLPPEIKELIAIYQAWDVELIAQRREVFKLEAALRALSGEIELRFKNLEERNAAASQVDAEVKATEAPPVKRVKRVRHISEA